MAKSERKKRHSPEYRKKFVSEVNRLRSEGYTLPEALEQAGGHALGTYRAWRDDLNGKKQSKVIFHKTEKPKKRSGKQAEIREAAPDKLICLIGTSEEVTKAVRNLGGF